MSPLVWVVDISRLYAEFGHHDICRFTSLNYNVKLVDCRRFRNLAKNLIPNVETNVYLFVRYSRCNPHTHFELGRRETIFFEYILDSAK